MKKSFTTVMQAKEFAHTLEVKKHMTHDSILIWELQKPDHEYVYVVVWEE